MDLFAVLGYSSIVFVVVQVLVLVLVLVPRFFWARRSARGAKFMSTPRDRATAGVSGNRKRPFAFTEHGAIMAASVLNSASAIQMSVVVVRAFVRLRQIVADHRQLAVRLNELERKYGSHDAHIAELAYRIPFVGLNLFPSPSQFASRLRLGNGDDAVPPIPARPPHSSPSSVPTVVVQ